MRIVGFIVVILLAAGLCWYFKVFEPAAAKAYREYRIQTVKAEADAPTPGFADVGKASLARIAVKITSCKVTGDTAFVTAKQTAYWLPEQAGGLNASTIEISSFEANLQKQSGKWVVTGETLLDTKTSYPEDRRRGL